MSYVNVCTVFPHKVATPDCVMAGLPLEACIMVLNALKYYLNVYVYMLGLQQEMRWCDPVSARLMANSYVSFSLKIILSSFVRPIPSNLVLCTSSECRWRTKHVASYPLPYVEWLVLF